MNKLIVAWRGNRVMLRKLGLAVLAMVVMAGLPSKVLALAPSVTLAPSVASPQMLGTPVTWTAAVQNSPTGHTYDYQFTVTFNGQAQIVRDFSPTNIFPWVPHTVEGAYQVSVIVRDITTAPYVLFAPVSMTFNLTPWVTAPLAAGVVNPTSNSLVALFSGPPCTAGHQLIVRFQPASSQVSMTTSPIACSQSSANFLVAGMYPSTQYLMHWEEYDGSSLVNTGATLSFTTGAIPSSFTVPTLQVNVPPTAHDAAYPVVLFQLLANAVATDLDGNVIWYITTPLFTRVEPGGIIFAVGALTLQQFDLAGNLVLETNAEILNEQLTAQGYPTINAFNTHEARHLPNGDIVLLGARDVASTSAQGGTPADPVDIIGDMVLVLNPNLQLVWAWDSFAHEDTNRAAILGETCTHGQGGCPAFNPSFTRANDWLHTNSAQGTADGNIIISQRHQDWALKINYANGAGDGSVIWHMGAGEDFTLTNPPSQTCGSPNNVFPWFTHQHDAAFQFEESDDSGGGTIMTVFDDGNTRVAECPAPQNSRGMVLFVNEAERQVTIETQANLGAYSSALGSGQLLAPGDGNLYASYDNGTIVGGKALATEVNLAGQVVYELQANAEAYRIYRMQNLDTPTFPFTATGVYAQTATPLQFGTIPFGTTEVLPMTVSNFGVPGTVTVGGSSNGPSYSVLATAQNTCLAGIAAGQSCTLPVQFNPATVGGHPDILTVTPSAGPLLSPVSLQGTASGIGVQMQNPLNFGTIPFGTTETLPLTVVNRGVPGTVTIGTSINGPSYTVLTTAQNTCLAGIALNQSCILPVQFNPVTVGGHPDILTVTASAGPAPSPVSLQGTASGVGVQIQTPLNFGTIPLGTTETLPLTVVNRGVPGTVTVGTSINDPSYTILTTAQNTCQAGIALNQSCTLPVQFAPATVGGHPAILTLTPSAGPAPSPVSLQGTAH